MKAQFPTEQTESGEFQRQEDSFRQWISNDGSTAYPAAAGRYHLYVSLACPWASRTVIFRKLKGLEEAIGMTIVDPIRDEKGWAFRDPSGKIPPGEPFESTDPINGFKFLSEVYKATDPNYAARVTVPVLWDKEPKRSSITARTTSAACSTMCLMISPEIRTSIFSRKISKPSMRSSLVFCTTM
jgi:putative glutathione S-transferase